MLTTDNIPTIGIDFGTSKSSMAWCDSQGRPQMLRNAEGDEETPSVVYVGADHTLVGRAALDMLDDPDERRRVILSVKRDMANPGTISVPGRRMTRVEVVAEILRKLRHDAEELHFHVPVTRAVIACPATFDAFQREQVLAAARSAGFCEVETVAEPVAAALAHAQQGAGTGKHILVYDLGAGTFDLAVLVRNPDGSFRVAMDPKGLERCGGDDFDRALYAYLDDICEQQTGMSLSSGGTLNMQVLQQCRERKEALASSEQTSFSTYLETPEGAKPFRHRVDRATFEGLIAEYVEATVRLTAAMVDESRSSNHPVDTLVLIGGSSRLPLVSRLLTETVPLRQTKWQQQDMAVALGAALHAQRLWGKPAARTSGDPALTAARQKLRDTVERAATQPPAGRPTSTGTRPAPPPAATPLRPAPPPAPVSAKPAPLFSPAAKSLSKLEATFKQEGFAITRHVAYAPYTFDLVATSTSILPTAWPSAFVCVVSQVAAGDDTAIQGFTDRCGTYVHENRSKLYMYCLAASLVDRVDDRTLAAFRRRKPKLLGQAKITYVLPVLLDLSRAAVHVPENLPWNNRRYWEMHRSVSERLLLTALAKQA